MICRFSGRVGVPPNVGVKLSARFVRRSLCPGRYPLDLPLDYSSSRSTETGNKAAANFEEAPDGILALGRR